MSLKVWWLRGKILDTFKDKQTLSAIWLRKLFNSIIQKPAFPKTILSVHRVEYIDKYIKICMKYTYNKKIYKYKNM